MSMLCCSDAGQSSYLSTLGHQPVNREVVGPASDRPAGSWIVINSPRPDLPDAAPAEKTSPAQIDFVVKPKATESKESATSPDAADVTVRMRRLAGAVCVAGVGGHDASAREHCKR